MEKPVKPEDTAKKGGHKRRKRCQENKKNCGKIETSSDPRTPNGIQHMCMLKIKPNEGYLQLCSNVFTANTNTSTRHKWGNGKIRK